MGYVRFAALLAFVTLAGCTTASGSFCSVARPIRLTKPTVQALTDAEVKEILSLNTTGERLCGWKP